MLEIQEYFDKKKDIEKELLLFLDDDDYNVNEISYQNLQNLFEDQKIRENVHDLNLINEIANDHHRYPNFFSKIDKLLLLFKEEIKQNFKNIDIFHIFQNNRRILLFLIQNEILYIDQEVFNQMINYYRYDMSEEYVRYFTPELKKQLDTKKVIYDSEKPLNFLEDLPENFEEKRQIGENDNELCEIIRNDQIENFIKLVNQNNLPLESNIEYSIYETNDLLLRYHHLELIEYAAFYGSIQIFKYLLNNNVKIRQETWFCAVHSENPEIFSILEENKVVVNDYLEQPFHKDLELYIFYPFQLLYNKYEIEYIDQNYNDKENENDDKEKDIYSKYHLIFLKILVESIKCHHNDIANYLCDKLHNYELNKNLYILESSLEYYNFYFIQNEIINQDSFFYFLCKFNYISPILLILNNPNIDNKINKCTLKFEYSSKKIEIKLTPLLAAIQTNNIELINILLISSKINVNEPIEMTEIDIFNEKVAKIPSFPFVYGRYMFGIDNTELVKLLLSSNNIDVNAPYIITKSFNCILTAKDTEMPKLSKEKPEIITKRSHYYEETAFMLAVESEDIDTIELLLSSNKIDINKIGKYSKSNENYDPREGQYSGESHYKMKDKTITPLITAIKSENIEIIKILLSNRNIDINLPYVYYSYRKLEWNTFQRGEGYCSYFFHDSRTINDSMSPLNYAITKNNIEIIKLLLDNKDIDVNFVRKYNDSDYNEYRGNIEKKEIKKEQTLLHQVVNEQNNEIVKLLISNQNIDTNLINYSYNYSENYYMTKKEDSYCKEETLNETSLYLAVKNGNDEIVKTLLSNKDIDINSKNTSIVKKDKEQKENVETPLQCASKNSNADIYNLLLRHSK